MNAKGAAGPSSLAEYLEESMEVLRRTRDLLPAERVEQAIDRIATALGGGRPLLVCGNGGSASDAEHITGELVGRFLKERRALKAISLVSTAAALTAIGNDYGYEQVFSRQVEAYAEPGGVVFGISTSGNSPNVVAAFEAARRHGMSTIALTGEGGGKMAGLSDVLLAVPSRHTPLIQQAHICLYHYICERVEHRLAA